MFRSRAVCDVCEIVFSSIVELQNYDVYECCEFGIVEIC